MDTAGKSILFLLRFNELDPSAALCGHIFAILVNVVFPLWCQFGYVTWKGTAASISRLDTAL